MDFVLMQDQGGNRALIQLTDVNVLSSTIRSSLKAIAGYDRDPATPELLRRTAIYKAPSSDFELLSESAPAEINYHLIPRALPIRGEVPPLARIDSTMPAIQFVIGYYTRQGFHVPPVDSIEAYANVVYGTDVL